MRLPIFQVDAFAIRRLTGNPAAVMPMDRFLDDAVLQAIAAENNLSETAFLIPDGGDYRLRWFTPLVEVPLCGHATLGQRGRRHGATAARTKQWGIPFREWAFDGEPRGARVRDGLSGTAVEAGFASAGTCRSSRRRAG